MNWERVIFITPGKDRAVFEWRKCDEADESPKELRVTKISECLLKWRKVDEGIEIRLAEEPTLVAIVGMPAVWRDKIWSNVYSGGEEMFIDDENVNKEFRTAAEGVIGGIEVVHACMHRQWDILSAELEPSRALSRVAGESLEGLSWSSPHLLLSVTAEALRNRRKRSLAMHFTPT